MSAAQEPFATVGKWTSTGTSGNPRATTTGGPTRCGVGTKQKEWTASCTVGWTQKGKGGHALRQGARLPFPHQKEKVLATRGPQPTSVHTGGAGLFPCIPRGYWKVRGIGNHTIRCLIWLIGCLLQPPNVPSPEMPVPMCLPTTTQSCLHPFLCALGPRLGLPGPETGARCSRRPPCQT